MGPGFPWIPASGGQPALSVRLAHARYRVPPSLMAGRRRTVYLLSIAYAGSSFFTSLGLGPG